MIRTGGPVAPPAIGVRVFTTDPVSLLEDAGRSLPERLDRISSRLLGSPYAAGPLVGSPTVPERLVTRTDAFDCVTFVETVFALALSEEPSDFPRVLQALRYSGGRLDWSQRHHYTSQWIAHNRKRGRVRLFGQDLRVRGKARDLDVVAGLPPVRWVPRYCPVGRAGRLEWRAGDLVAFVSTRADLDVFHVGLVIPGEAPTLRHASRSRGRVLDQPLASFLAENDTPGLLVARLRGKP